MKFPDGKGVTHTLGWPHLMCASYGKSIEGKHDFLLLNLNLIVSFNCYAVGSW
jgi:hypothetical protein